MPCRHFPVYGGAVCYFRNYQALDPHFAEPGQEVLMYHLYREPDGEDGCRIPAEAEVWVQAGLEPAGADQQNWDCAVAGQVFAGPAFVPAAVEAGYPMYFFGAGLVQVLPQNLPV